MGSDLSLDDRCGKQARDCTGGRNRIRSCGVRLERGGWLLLASFVLMCVGGVVWHREHTTVQPPQAPSGIDAQAGADTAPIGTMIASVGSGRFGIVGPAHAPAIWLFVIGGAAGLVGAFLLSRGTPTVGDDGVSDAG